MNEYVIGALEVLAIVDEQREDEWSAIIANARCAEYARLVRLLIAGGEQ